MNIVELERALTAFFAELLELEVDTTIFRGVLSANVNNAIGVILSIRDTGNTPSKRHYSLQLLGRFDDQDAARILAEKIEASFPLYAPEWVILKDGCAGTYDTPFDGNDITGISANLEVIV